MHIVIIIVCVILWAVVQASLKDKGVPPRTRGSLRYQRRKARKMGAAPEDVEIAPRPADWEPSDPIGTSHASDIAYGLGGGCLSIAVMAVGVVVIFASGWSGDFILPWMLLVVVGTAIAHYRRTGSWL